MNRIHLVLIPCLLVVILLCMVVSPTYAHSKSVPPATCGQWSAVKSPNRANYPDNALSGVAAISANDVWAVGESDKIGVHSKFVGLTEHWDGNTWSIVPDAGPTGTELVGVAAVATNDVWAVGSYYDKTQQVFYPVIEHWDGTAWSAVTNQAPANSELLAVAAISSTDVWAVGNTVQGNSYITLTMHWDGTTWSVIPSPNEPSAGNFLMGVTAISTSDVWAVGQVDKKVKVESFFEHWDGTKWTLVTSPTKIANRPPPQVVDYQLDSIAAASSQMVWSVGVVNNYLQSTQNILIERWDGTQWTIDSSVKIAGSLSAVSALSPGNAWAVGSGQTNPLILHWDGTAWHVVPDPSNAPFLNAVAQVPGTTQAWTVGYNHNIQSGNDKTFTAYYC